MQILTAALREEHRRAGLYLEEDDHLVYLKRAQRILAKFSATGASIKQLHAEADKYLTRELITNYVNGNT